MRRLFRIIKKDPWGSMICFSIAGFILAFTFSVFVIIMFSIQAPEKIKNKFHEETGYYLTAENIFVNYLNGTVRIQNAVVFSPIDYKDTAFLEINSALFQFSKIGLLNYNFHIYKADIRIKKLHCTRLSASRYNLREFIEKLENFVTFANDQTFLGLNLEISSCEYHDVVSKDIHVKWASNAPIRIQTLDIHNRRKFNLLLRDAFEKSDASFMTNVLKLNE